MSDNNNIINDEYPIDTDLLSILDVTREGKVVSAKNWNTLWQVAIKRLNKVSEFNTRLENFNTTWETNYAKFTKQVSDMEARYAALEKSFVHYGETEPTDEHIKFWVQPVEYMEPDKETGTLTVQLSKAALLDSISDSMVEQRVADGDIKYIGAETSNGFVSLNEGYYTIPAGSTITIVYTRTKRVDFDGGFGYTVQATILTDTAWVVSSGTDYSAESVVACNGHYVVTSSFSERNGMPSISNSVEHKFYKAADVTLSKISTVTLKASSWINSSSPYQQTISLQNVTASSKIDLNPTPVQLNEFLNKGCSFVVENKNAKVTVYCIGTKPTVDYTMQVTVTEVSK